MYGLNRQLMRTFARHFCWSALVFCWLVGCAEVRTTYTLPPTNTKNIDPDTSKKLEDYYGELATTLQSQGLLRTDRHASDIPYSVDDLVRNFETIVFYDEYQRGSAFEKSKGKKAKLSKWVEPIKLQIHFGPSIAQTTVNDDKNTIEAFVSQVASITSHPMSIVAENGNFDVLISREYEYRALLDELKAKGAPVTPGVNRILEQMPRNVHCLVLAFSDVNSKDAYSYALAVIRAEHPKILKQACIHEEIAQGLGLGNDSPRARPSIFNDDDEFALLTDHDAILLEMLYDPRLTPGLSLSKARPILHKIASELTQKDI